MKQINKWANLNKYNLRNDDDNLLWDQKIDIELQIIIFIAQKSGQ